MAYALQTICIWPRGFIRACPAEVPQHLKQDFLEASQVLPISPKASAALSRRCLQQILKEAGGARKRDLADQIQEVIDSGHLRTDLEQQLDAVRNIGNFAAHTQKSTNTGAILDVEPQEAEWNLEVVAELFDHYFVRPALAKVRTDALNKKLKEAGKPALA